MEEVISLVSMREEQCPRPAEGALVKSLLTGGLWDGANALEFIGLLESISCALAVFRPKL